VAVVVVVVEWVSSQDQQMIVIVLQYLRILEFDEVEQLRAQLGFVLVLVLVLVLALVAIPMISRAFQDQLSDLKYKVLKLV